MMIVKPVILALGFALGAAGARLLAPNEDVVPSATASTGAAAAPAVADALGATPDASPAVAAPDPVGEVLGRAAEAPPPASQVPDPELEPGGWVSAFTAWWRNGGKVPAVLVTIIGLVHVVLRRVSWLQVGWRRAAVTCALVGASTLLDTWLSSGAAGNLTMWLFGGAAAIVAYLSRAAPPTSAKDPEPQVEA